MISYFLSINSMEKNYIYRRQTLVAVDIFKMTYIIINIRNYFFPTFWVEAVFFFPKFRGTFNISVFRIYCNDIIAFEQISVRLSKRTHVFGSAAKQYRFSLF